MWEGVDNIEIAGKQYGIKVEYHDKKNSSVQISKDAIFFRISNRLNERGKREAYNSLVKWAIRSIEKYPKRYAVERKPLRHNDEVKIFGKTYRILISETIKKMARARLVGNAIAVELPYNFPNKDKAAEELVRRVVSADLLPGLRRFVNELNKRHFNAPINNVKVRHQKSRWGSCSEKGNINIAFDLLKAPLPIIEYVCAHEIAHLIENNHSRDFWRLVERAVPDYRGRKRWLRENGGLLRRSKGLL